jgi:AraC family transcriptional regulator, transcriptional activator of pobA
MINQIPTHSFSHKNGEDRTADLFLWDTVRGYNFSEPHAHSFNEIIFFEKGGGNHIMSNEKHEICDFSFHILPSGYIHRLERLETSVGFTIAFSDHFIKQMQQFDKKTNYANLIEYPTSVNLRKEDFDEFSVSFQELKIHQDKEPIRLNIIAIIFFKLLEKISFNQPKIDSSNFELNSMMLLNKYYRERQSTSFYASKMNLSTQTFSKKMKEMYAKSIIDLQNEKIISEAKRMLKTDELTISQIAFSLGFKEESQFSHFFKLHTEQSPKAFRNV